MDEYARDTCWTVQAYSLPHERLDLNEVRAGFLYDEMLFQKALLLANTEFQEDFISDLSLQAYTSGLVACHTDWYLEGTGEQKADYIRLFNYFKETGTKQNFYVSNDWFGEHNCTVPELGDKLNPAVNVAEFFEWVLPGEPFEWWK